ncbi:hypothetical protein QTG54_014821 [Skeletonema marinoi]|uniref:Uncharacterized protein n=1 Tax=Skeletonema marinoi TaxID=267567 RepID=A0AAD8XVR3_9STRA|nr:hypothetical protein QTG54_014821 [Skeletonema marinoi]
MMSSDASKKEGLDADNEGGGDCTSVSSKPENNKQRRMRSGDISSTTNEPSSASATVSSVGAKHPTAQSALPTLADAAVAAAPPTAAVKKKPRRAGFRQQFLQQVRETSRPPHGLTLIQF